MNFNNIDKGKYMKENNIKKYREFGLIWSVIFLGIFLFLFFNDNKQYVLLVISFLFLVIVFFKPILLKSFYHFWIKFGNTIGSIISKVIMFILYFGLFTPVSLILRILGKDLLHKKVDKKSSTYWIKREVQPQSMKNQF